MESVEWAAFNRNETNYMRANASTPIRDLKSGYANCVMKSLPFTILMCIAPYVSGENNETKKAFEKELDEMRQAFNPKGKEPDRPFDENSYHSYKCVVSRAEIITTEIRHNLFDLLSVELVEPGRLKIELPDDYSSKHGGRFFVTEPVAIYRTDQESRFNKSIYELQYNKGMLVLLHYGALNVDGDWLCMVSFIEKKRIE